MFEHVAGKCCVRALQLVLLAAAASGVRADEISGLADPTMPLDFNVSMQDMDAAELAGQALSGFINYRLNSVLIRKDDRIAVVNGQRVRVGDMLGAARIAGIDNAGVILDINGETSVLALYGEPVKTLVAAGDAQ